MKRISLFFSIVCLSILLFSCSNNSSPENNKEEVIIPVYTKDETKSSETTSSAEIDELKERLKLVERERLEFRKDIENIISKVDERGIDFIGFSQKNSVHMAHKKVILDYLDIYKGDFYNNPDYYKDIKPIIAFFSAKPAEKPFMEKINGVYYYEVSFYRAAVLKKHSEAVLRSWFDGIYNWVIQIHKINGEWKVKDFGPDI